MNISELRTLARTKWGTEGDVQVAAAIAMAESGGVVDVVGDNYLSGHQPWDSPARYDYGLWQVNSQHGYDRDRLLSDPDYSAQAAYEIQQAQGWTAWATYNGGQYAAFLFDIGPEPAEPLPSPIASPYVGLDGVQAAWKRFGDWIQVDLPQQWMRLKMLLDEISASGAIAPLPVPAPPLPPPSPLPGWSLIEYERWFTTQADPQQTTVYNQVSATLTYIGLGLTVQVIGGVGWSGAPDMWTWGAQEFGADIMICADEVTIWPPGEGLRFRPDCRKWVQGERVTWG